MIRHDGSEVKGHLCLQLESENEVGRIREFSPMVGNKRVVPYNETMLQM